MVEAVQKHCQIYDSFMSQLFVNILYMHTTGMRKKEIWEIEANMQCYICFFIEICEPWHCQNIMWWPKTNLVTSAVMWRLLRVYGLLDTIQWMYKLRAFVGETTRPDFPKYARDHFIGGISIYVWHWCLAVLVWILGIKWCPNGNANERIFKNWA